MDALFSLNGTETSRLPQMNNTLDLTFPSFLRIVLRSSLYAGKRVHAHSQWFGSRSDEARESSGGEQEAGIVWQFEKSHSIEGSVAASEGSIREDPCSLHSR